MMDIVLAMMCMYLCGLLGVIIGMLLPVSVCNVVGDSIEAAFHMMVESVQTACRKVGLP